MHVAFINPFLNKNSRNREADGIPTYVHALVESLMIQHDNVEITIFATSRTGDSPHRSRVDIPLGTSGKFLSVESGFRIGIVGFLQILGVVFQRRFAIIHLQHETFLYGGPMSLLTFPLFCLALRLRGAPVVTLHHVVSQGDITPEFRHIHYTKTPLPMIRWGYRWFFWAIGKCARVLIVHHEHFRKILMQEYGVHGDRVAAVPHGIHDMGKQALLDRNSLIKMFGLPETTRTIFGFLGFATGYKGLDVLIREFAIHAAQIPDTALLICAGEHPHNRSFHEYQEYLRTLKIAAAAIPGNRVIWKEYIPTEEIQKFFAAIDCLVLPYRSSAGASGILAHAITYEKPMIVSECLKDFAHGSSVASLESWGLSSALSRFSHATSEERKRMKEILRTAKQEESWQIVGARILALYNIIAAPVQKPILLLGAYGQRNLGDELLLSRCLQTLPRGACAVVSSDPKRTTREHGIAAIPRSGSPMRLLKAIWNARAIIVGGGDQFKLMKPMMRRSRYALLTLDALLASVARLCGKQLTFVGVGIGDIATRRARWLTRWTLNRADAVLFRDAQSFRMAQKLAPHAHTALSADLAFMNTAPHPALSPRKGERGTHALGIAPCAHMDKADAYGHVMQEIAKAASLFLQKDPGRRVSFLPFQTGCAAHHDILVSREILAQIRQADRCTIQEKLNVTTVDPLYASLDYLWGMRLHSIILAVLHAVPFVALIYDVKVQNFLEEVNCEEWGIPVDAAFDAEKLVELQSRLERRLPEIRRHLAMQAGHLRIRAKANADLLKEIAEAASSHALENNHETQSAIPSALSS